MIKTEQSKYVKNNITGGVKVTKAFSLSTKLSFHFLTSGELRISSWLENFHLIFTVGFSHQMTGWSR